MPEKDEVKYVYPSKKRQNTTKYICAPYQVSILFFQTTIDFKKSPKNLRTHHMQEGLINLSWLERAAGLLEEDENQDGCSDLRAHWPEI